MLGFFLRKIVRRGLLAVTFPNGQVERYGNGHGEIVSVRIRDRVAAFKLALHPDLYLAECFMDGSLSMEQGSIWNLLDLIGDNIATMPQPSRLRTVAASGFRALGQINARRAARRNVAHHYDLSENFFRSFLDADMQYSCAYFRSPDVTLDEAQFAKKVHIAAKLALEPGQRVLDIGCGWGGMAIYLAQHAQVYVHGISLSVEQLNVCRQRVEALGLSDRVTFELIDYRDVQGTYDRIVSVGMFEHVGAPNYATFFGKIERLLSPSGVALVHSIGRSFSPSYTSSFIRKHIFPGGYAPSLSQVLPRIERAGLRLNDMEILRLHYAETLRRWRERFVATSPVGMDPRFRRMWEFYLAVSEMSFRHLDFIVFQAQLTRRIESLPITRDYITEHEDRAAATLASEPLAA